MNKRKVRCQFSLCSSVYIPKTNNPRFPCGLPIGAVGNMLIPGSNRLLEMRMIGTVLSSMAFSIAFILGIACLAALFKSRNSPHYSRWQFYCLSTYVIIMLSISIFSIAENALSLFGLTFHGTQPFHLKSGSPISLPLAIWGADAFMVSALSIFQSFILDLTIGRRFTEFKAVAVCHLISGCAPNFSNSVTLPRWIFRGQGIGYAFCL